MPNRQEKIQMLSRMNRGRVSTPAFLAALSDAIGEPVEIGTLVSLPETDSLTAAFREGYQRAATQSGNSYQRFFVPSEERRVYKLADCLAEKLPDEGAFFLTKLSEECGAVRLNLSILLRHTESIIRLDGDSVSALSKDRQQGLLIDRNQDDLEQAYEITAWGDRWPSLILACDESS